MISTGKRKPLYDGTPVPTRAPLGPPRRRSADHPSRQAATQVDDAERDANGVSRFSFPVIVGRAATFSRLLTIDFTRWMCIGVGMNAELSRATPSIM
jgi:hypothetical protein